MKEPTEDRLLGAVIWFIIAAALYAVLASMVYAFAWLSVLLAKAIGDGSAAVIMVGALLSMAVAVFRWSGKHKPPSEDED